MMNSLRWTIGLASAVMLGSGAALAAAPATVADEAQDIPRLAFAFEELVTLSPPVEGGQTPYGGRVMIPITGGNFEGPGIKGHIIPGGWDWQLKRPDGCVDVRADYMLETDDSVMINVINKGTVCTRDGKMLPARTTPVFEAPLGKYQWLGQAAFIGTLAPATGSDGKPAVRIRFYKAI